VQILNYYNLAFGLQHQWQNFVTDPPVWQTDGETDGWNCHSIYAL